MKQLLTLSFIMAVFTAKAQTIAVASNFEVDNYTVISEPIDLNLQPQGEFKKREPGVAFLLSFLVSGTGQFYNGQPGKGAAMLGTSLLGVILYASGTKTEESNILGGSVESQKSAGTAATGVALIVASGLWSMIDAPISAGKLNKENGVALRVQPSVQLVQSNKLVLGPSVSLKF